jgi:hypothetical protein
MADADAVKRTAGVARSHCHRAGSWRLIRRPQSLAALRKCHLRVQSPSLRRPIRPPGSLTPIDRRTTVSACPRRKRTMTPRFLSVHDMPTRANMNGAVSEGPSLA